MDVDILHNFQAVQQEVENIAIRAGRDPGNIKIIAVSKTFPEKVVQSAIASGIHIFGENKVQEAKRKKEVLTGNYELHMIGHLQSNKVKDAVKIFDFIHSIDKLNTAVQLNNEAIKINKVQNILIQVKTSDELTKSGIGGEQLEELLEGCLQLTNLKVHGLMTMAPFTNNDQLIRKSFATARQLLDAINKKGLSLTELSMGMTSDYKIAIEEGATMVRIGTAIFGERTYY